MIRPLLVAALLFVAAPAFAQEQFKWYQPTAEVAAVNRFELRMDGGAYVNAGRTQGVDPQTPPGMTTFVFAMPPQSPGVHNFTVRACPATGPCTADAPVFSYTLLSVPSGLRTGPPGEADEGDHNP